MECRPKYEVLRAEIEKLTTDIEAAVLKAGESVKGSDLIAVYSAGRVTWNTKALDGYAAAHNEIEQFKKIGKPSVTIRKIQ
jgi:hypothetical protein